MPVKSIAKTRPSKQQERTDATRAKLLAAAQNVFTRDGFAAARLEQIALEAGYTRGAIYAHYKSKEDLFLDLFEQRVKTVMADYRALVEGEESHEERVRKFRAMIVKKASDKSWALLMLELKLYALRQPKLKARMLRIMAMLQSTSREDFMRSLFGDLKPKAVQQIERRLVLLGSVLTATVLESHFRPELLSGRHLDATLAEIVEALVHCRGADCR